MNVLLISTYELGRQPFGLASPAAWLKAQGHQVHCADLAVERLDPAAVRNADLVAFHLPMHTATRLAAPVIEKVKRLNPAAKLTAYGLYAPLNETYLRSLGIETIVGGEFEANLLDHGTTLVSLDRLQFQTPDRTTLPVLSKYAKVEIDGTQKIAGYTEATRGCKYKCRHCPIVPIYNGTFRVIQSEVVLNDVRQQVASGAQHITFGDPDFLNGPTHALHIVNSLHREFPNLTYDVTIKIEHLLKHRRHLETLKTTGCLFITSAVESVDDQVLDKLDKHHTRQDFIEAVHLLNQNGLTLNPTFIPFTPWTTKETYKYLLATIAGLDLIENVAPVQLALRLLITQGSRLLELDDIKAVIEGYDHSALLYRWAHPNPEMDLLAKQALKIAAQNTKRTQAFVNLWSLITNEPAYEIKDRLDRAAIPYINEPWYC